MEQERGGWVDEGYSSAKSGKVMATGRESSPKKPWWLVIFILLLLIGSSVYIVWLNSPDAERYASFWTYLFGPSSAQMNVDEPALPVDSADFSAILPSIPDTTLSATTAYPDSNSTSDWDTPSTAGEPTAETPVSRPFEETAALPVSPATTPTAPLDEKPAASGYYIQAGKFKSKGSALFRIKELRQGNYPARLIEPSSGDGYFTVSAGEYESYSRAKEQARVIGFILEIETSVQEMN